MLENLSYIYQAMYTTDMYDNLNAVLFGLSLFIPIVWGITWVITLFASIEIGNGAFGKMWNATKWFQIASAVILLMVICISTIMPSKNTVKAYILVNDVKEKVDKDKVDSLVNSVKQQAIDSVLATIKK